METVLSDGSIMY